MNPNLTIWLFIIANFAWPLSSLPYIFERAVEGRTALMLNASSFQRDLGPLLSRGATLYFPFSPGFANATSRWSAYAEPQIAAVVEPGDAADVSITVTYAGKYGIPFLAVNKGHGSTETLGRARMAIEIHIRSLNNIALAPDGNTASVGDGTFNQELIDAVWAQGKASASGSCACVGLMGAALGGGLGRYQGFYGLLADNMVDADLVLANGKEITVSKTAYPDLFWGIQGAGHNFGIVTRFTLRIFDSPSQDWYFAQFIFTEDKLERFVAQVNEMMNNGTQRKELMNYFVLARDAAISTDPIIVFNIFYIGTKEQAAPYTAPYFDLDPAFHNDSSVPYPVLASVTGLGVNDFSCQHGYNRLQYPVGLLTYNVSNVRAVYQAFQKQTEEIPALNFSTAVFEGYSLEGVKAVPADSTAYPHREDNILASILAVYAPDPTLDATAVAWARSIRDLMQAGQPTRQLNAYVNYAFGDETPEQVYGYEPWRLERLRGLKRKYDPFGRYNFYEPIAL